MYRFIIHTGIRDWNGQKLPLWLLHPTKSSPSTAPEYISRYGCTVDTLQLISVRRLRIEIDIIKQNEAFFQFMFITAREDKTTGELVVLQVMKI